MKTKNQEEKQQNLEKETSKYHKKRFRKNRTLFGRRKQSSRMYHLKMRRKKGYQKLGSVWLDTNKKYDAESFYEILEEIINLSDLEIAIEYMAIKGSWLKRFVIRAKNSDDFQKGVKKIERALELKHIDKVQSEVDLNIAEAISKLTVAHKDIPNFSVFFGNLLYVKATINGKIIIFAQTLTQEQLEIVSKNPDLLKNPLELINKMKTQKAIV